VESKLGVADLAQLHFEFSTEIGMRIEQQVALDTLNDFDRL